MNSTGMALAGALVMLVLTLFALGEGPNRALAMQDGVPAATVDVTRTPSDDGPVYRIVITEVGGQQARTIIAEPSDVSGVTHILHEAGEPPTLLSLSPVLASLARAGEESIREITLEQETESPIGSTLYLVREGGALLSAPDVGLTLFVLE